MLLAISIIATILYVSIIIILDNRNMEEDIWWNSYGYLLSIRFYSCWLDLDGISLCGQARMWINGGPSLWQWWSILPYLTLFWSLDWSWLGPWPSDSLSEPHGSPLTGICPPSGTGHSPTNESSVRPSVRLWEHVKESRVGRPSRWEALWHHEIFWNILTDLLNLDDHLLGICRLRRSRCFLDPALDGWPFRRRNDGKTVQCYRHNGYHRFILYCTWRVRLTDSAGALSKGHLTEDSLDLNPICVTLRAGHLG